MADNITAPATGAVLATDEVGGVHHPIGKTAWGADGTVVQTADANGARLPVKVGEALPAGNNNIGDVDVASVPVTATTTRAYGYAAGQRLTTAGAGQVRSTAVTATEVLLHASVRGFFRVGASDVVATVGPGSIPLAADEKFHLRITSGEFVSFIRDGATDGSLTIMPVA